MTYVSFDVLKGPMLEIEVRTNNSSALVKMFTKHLFDDIIAKDSLIILIEWIE